VASKTVLYGLALATLSFVGLVGVPSAAGTSVRLKPVLFVSVNRGGPGTHVHVKGVNCAPLGEGQRDELTWHDSYQVAHRDSGYRKVRDLHRKHYTVTALFTVSARDPSGWGVLDLFCGDLPSAGNAIARFLVTR